MNHFLMCFQVIFDHRYNMLDAQLKTVGNVFLKTGDAAQSLVRVIAVATVEFIVLEEVLTKN